MAKTILIIDDDAPLRAIVGDLLRDEGYEVLDAPDGLSALRLLAALPRDTRLSGILLDMRMPLLDGWGFAAAYREQGGSVPLICFTAAPDAAARAQEIGIAHVVSKPFQAEDLLKVVAAATAGA